MPDPGCHDCLDVCPDVALGVATAEDRAMVLTHVERCRSCGDELASLSDVADLLSVLVPAVDPPRGFTSRVVGAISSPTKPLAHAAPVRRALMRPVSLAAALVVAAGLALGGWLAARGSSTPSPSTVQTAALLSHDHRVGRVMLVPGGKLWMSVAVHLAASSTVVRCRVESDGGVWRTLGTFDVYDGRGYWVATLPRGFSVARAELTTTRGRVLASASLTGA
ncbi:MAG TPA: hypothetical protein VMD28_01545 [Acidimicrobiales bacterium]|nr:hypothetical protein [Acidimicrobiales bacterium]